MTPARKTDDDKHWIPYWLTSGKRTCRYEISFALSMMVWAVSVALCMYLLKNELVTAPFSWAVALAPLLVAIIPIRAYFVFMSHADELIRKIQLESIAIGFCSGLLYALTRALLDAAGAEPAMAGGMLAIMLFAFGFAQIYLAWKYR